MVFTMIEINSKLGPWKFFTGRLPIFYVIMYSTYIRHDDNNTKKIFTKTRKGEFSSNTFTLQFLCPSYFSITASAL
jgi:hypothetical protein